MLKGLGLVILASASMAQAKPTNSEWINTSIKGLVSYDRTKDPATGSYIAYRTDSAKEAAALETYKQECAKFIARAQKLFPGEIGNSASCPTETSSDENPDFVAFSLVDTDNYVKSRGWAFGGTGYVSPNRSNYEYYESKYEITGINAPTQASALVNYDTACESYILKAREVLQDSLLFVDCGTRRETAVSGFTFKSNPIVYTTRPISQDPVASGSNPEPQPTPAPAAPAPAPAPAPAAPAPAPVPVDPCTTQEVINAKGQLQACQNDVSNSQRETARLGGLLSGLQRNDSTVVNNIQQQNSALQQCVQSQDVVRNQLSRALTERDAKAQAVNQINQQIIDNNNYVNAVITVSYNCTVSTTSNDKKKGIAAMSKLYIDVSSPADAAQRFYNDWLGLAGTNQVLKAARLETLNEKGIRVQCAQPKQDPEILRRARAEMGDGPRGDGPRNDGPRGDGPRNDGPGPRPPRP